MGSGMSGNFNLNANNNNAGGGTPIAL